jgi:23S rRNA (uracil1939-C5)-methyltransferase
MSRNRKNIFLPKVPITDMAHEGRSVAKVDGCVVFVEGAVPGDVADLRVFRKKSSFMEAVPTHYHQYSPHRVPPACQHFGVCGGCKWQHLDYAAQLRFKQEQVVQNLARIGKLDLPEISPIIPSSQTFYYRNKLEFTFTSRYWLTADQVAHPEEAFEDRRGLGFHVPKMFDKVLDIEHCHLQPDPSNAIRNGLRDFAKEAGLEFFDLKSQEGLLRNLVIRTANTGDVMAIVIFSRHDRSAIEQVMAFLQENFPQITSLQYIVNPKRNDSYADLDVHCHAGLPYIVERMEDLQFRVGPKSFYQTNAEQAYELYKVAREFAGLSGHEVVYDLYTGTGTIAQFVARQAKQVVGIEYVPAAIDDAKANAQVNGLRNTSFYAGDMKDLLNDAFLEANGRPDVVITDPPRAGMHEDVVRMLCRIAAPRVVYVSCNSATQARDLALMKDLYDVKAVQPVDMFPHTQHVENVVLLERKP